LNNIFIQFGVPMTETYSEVSVSKNLFDAFPTQNDLTRGDALSPFLFNFALEYDICKV